MSQDYRTTEEQAAYDQQLKEYEIGANQRNWAKGEAGRLCEELYRAYIKYQQYLERNPFAKHQSHDVEAVSQKLYLQLRENLEKAQVAERCLHIKSNGSQCGSPRMKKSRLCFAHTRMKETRPNALGLPSLEDPNGVQLAIMKLVQLLIDDKVDAKKAGMLAYLIQTAANNVGKVDFSPEEEPVHMTLASSRR